MTTKTFIASRDLTTRTVEFDGVTYYLVDDGAFLYAVTDGEYEAHCDDEYEDYTAWCQGTDGVTDADLAARIAAAAGLPRIHLADGTSTQVEAFDADAAADAAWREIEAEEEGAYDNKLIDAFETERDEEATRTLIETTAWACAEEQVRQGATSWDPQGVIYQGDVDALTNALGRESNEDELEYFREVFVGAIESEAKAAAKALSSTAAWETYVGNQPIAEWLRDGGATEADELENYLAETRGANTSEATRPIIARKLSAEIERVRDEGIEVELDSPTGPRVIYHPDLHDQERVEAALPAGWVVDPDDWSLTVKRGQWRSTPISRVD